MRKCQPRASFARSQLWTANGFAVCRRRMAHPIPKQKGFCCAPQVAPFDISHFQKSAHPNFRNRSDTKPFDQTQQNMTMNCHRHAPHQEITTKHACAHECLATVESQPASREASLKEEKSAKTDADTRE